MKETLDVAIRRIASEYMEEMEKKYGHKDFAYWNGLEKGIELGANWYRNNLWHDASEEPCDMGHCLINFGGKGKVRYLDFALVFYNKYEKAFITEPYPHPTGYKVEQKSVDGGCSAEVYKYKRDRIPLSDIAKWCYLSDIL